MRVFPIALALAITFMTAGCSEPEVGYEPVLDSCICDDPAACPPSSCQWNLTLHDNCLSEFDFAEVIIDGYLEPQDLAFGQAFAPCSEVQPGTTGEIIVRGGDWIWGPMTRSCDAQNKPINLTFECREQGPGEGDPLP